jgi:predicted nicotinamide N-methyase
MFSSEATREVRLKAGDAPILLTEDSCRNTGGVGGELWDGAIVLGLWLRGCGAAAQTVLELGAGTGLVGVSAALGGALCLMTDRGDALHLTRRNADANRGAVEAAGGRIGVAELDWTNPPSGAAWEHGCVVSQHASSPCGPYSQQQASAYHAETDFCGGVHHQAGWPRSDKPGWDVVCGSDILYDGRLYRDLVQVLARAVQTHTICVLSYSVSPHEALLAKFFTLAAEEGLHVQQVGVSVSWRTCTSQQYGIASGCRHLGLTCDVRAVPVQTLRGEAIEELLGEHGAQLYSQHGNGDGDDVVLVVMTRVVDEPETPGGR